MRLDIDQAAAVAALEAKTGLSAAAILLQGLGGGMPAIPAPPKLLPAVADGALLLTISQIGGILGKGIRDRSLPAQAAERAIKSLEASLAAYERMANAHAK